MDFDTEKTASKNDLPHHSSSGVSTPTTSTEPREWEDEDVEKVMEEDGHRDGHLSRTKSAMSIADTLSLPREIAFIGVICMANFMARSSSRSPLCIF